MLVADERLSVSLTALKLLFRMPSECCWKGWRASKRILRPGMTSPWAAGLVLFLKNGLCSLSKDSSQQNGSTVGSAKLFAHSSSSFMILTTS